MFNNVAFKTLELIHVVAELKIKSKNGIRPFSECESGAAFGKCVWFDDMNEIYNGAYPIIMEAQIDDEHHDIVTLLSDWFEDVEIIVCTDDVGEKYVSVRDKCSDGEIVVDKGRSYVAAY